jgi:hypothetical protein
MSHLDTLPDDADAGPEEVLDQYADRDRDRAGAGDLETLRARLLGMLHLEKHWLDVRQTPQWHIRVASGRK